MVSSHSRVLAHSVKVKAPVLGGNAVNVHGPITALSSNILVEWIPCNALDIVIVFGNLVDALA